MIAKVIVHESGTTFETWLEDASTRSTPESPVELGDALAATRLQAVPLDRRPDGDRADVARDLRHRRSMTSEGFGR